MLSRLAVTSGLAAALFVGFAGTALAGEDFLKAIAPGNESLVAEMLGGPLPGGCALDEASIERTRVVARFTCAAGAATVVLHHPEDPAAAAPAARTAMFAIVSSAPRDLIDAVAAHVAAHEKDWRWMSIEPSRHSSGSAHEGPAPTADALAGPTSDVNPTTDVEALAGPPPPHRFFTTPATFAASALAIAAASGLALRLALRRARSG